MIMSRKKYTNTISTQVENPRIQFTSIRSNLSFTYTILYLNYFQNGNMFHVDEKFALSCEWICINVYNINTFLV